MVAALAEASARGGRRRAGVPPMERSPLPQSLPLKRSQEGVVVYPPHPTLQCQQQPIPWCGAPLWSSPAPELDSARPKLYPAPQGAKGNLVEHLCAEKPLTAKVGAFQAPKDVVRRREQLPIQRSPSSSHPSPRGYSSADHSDKQCRKTHAQGSPLDSGLSLRNFEVPECAMREYEAKGVTKLHPWQARCLNIPGVLQGTRTLLYMAPTSGGKSLVAEIILLKQVLEHDNTALGILTLPYVSICQVCATVIIVSLALIALRFVV